MLNFLQRLSGIATTTSRYVRAVKGTKAKIYDTRKTLPGWRLLEKYAVRLRQRLQPPHRPLRRHSGQGQPYGRTRRHFPEQLRQLVAKARKVKGLQFVAVEVDHVDDQLNHVLTIPGIDIVLLDNMGQWQLKHAVEMHDAMCGGNRPSGSLRQHHPEQRLGDRPCSVDRIAVRAIALGRRRGYRSG